MGHCPIVHNPWSVTRPRRPGVGYALTHSLCRPCYDNLRGGNVVYYMYIVVFRPSRLRWPENWFGGVCPWPSQRTGRRSQVKLFVYSLTVTFNLLQARQVTSILFHNNDYYLILTIKPWQKQANLHINSAIVS